MNGNSTDYGRSMLNAALGESNVNSAAREEACVQIGRMWRAREAIDLSAADVLESLADASSGLGDKTYFYMQAFLTRYIGTTMAAIITILGIYQLYNAIAGGVQWLKSAISNAVRWLTPDGIFNTLKGVFQDGATSPESAKALLVMTEAAFPIMRLFSGAGTATVPNIPSPTLGSGSATYPSQLVYPNQQATYQPVAAGSAYQPAYQPVVAQAPAPSSSPSTVQQASGWMNLITQGLDFVTGLFSDATPAMDADPNNVLAGVYAILKRNGLPAEQILMQARALAHSAENPTDAAQAFDHGTVGFASNNLGTQA